MKTSISFNANIRFTKEQIEELEKQIWEETIKQLGEDYKIVDYDIFVSVVVLAEKFKEVD